MVLDKYSTWTLICMYVCVYVYSMTSLCGACFKSSMMILTIPVFHAICVLYIHFSENTPSVHYIAHNVYDFE